MSKIKVAILPVTGIFDRVLQRASVNEEVKPYLEMSDEELIVVLQAGDQQAFSHVMDRYQGKLYAYVMRLTNHRDEAHDIVQDVFMKAYKNIHRFDTERKFSSWVYRIAHNESVNWLKKKTRAKVESLENRAEAGIQLADKVDVEEDYIVKEDQIMVREAIEKLPAKYQEVMDLRYLQQQSYEEISKRLDKPINTVGTLINRAKKKLASELTL